MKPPKLIYEGGLSDFISSNPDIHDRDSCNAFVVDSIYRAQRMSSAGLRHLSVILGANKNAGKKDRWNKDPLATLYFGRGASVTEIRAVHRRLERAHRRLRDNVLTVRLRPRDPDRIGRNTGGPFTPRSFRLYADWAFQNPPERAGTIIHELLHEWLIDRKIGGERAYSVHQVQRLAIANKSSARQNPSNFEHFCLAVWRDAGIETPSGGDKPDEPLHIASINIASQTGEIRDRPLITRARLKGTQKRFVAAVHGAGTNNLHMIGYRESRAKLQREVSSDQTGDITGSPSICLMASNHYVTAVHGAGNNRLILIAWRWVDGQMQRFGDSGDLFGSVHATPDVTWIGGRYLTVAFKVKSGRMKVVMLRLDSDGRFHRLADAETSGPITNAPSICHVGPNAHSDGLPSREDPSTAYVATAFVSREGRMSFDVWVMDVVNRRVQRAGGHLDRSLTDRPAIAGTPKGDVATAVRDKDTGRLRLTFWEVIDPQRPRRLGDSGNDGVRMTHSPSIAAIARQFSPVYLTAMRMADGGRLRVNRWSWSSASVREADSGDRGPVIARSPSVANHDIDLPYRAVTACTSPDNRLLLHHWKER